MDGWCAAVGFAEFRGRNTQAPLRFTQTCHSERSEESHMAQSKFDCR